MRASFYPSSFPAKRKKEEKALAIENLLLRRQNDALRQRLLSDQRIENQIKKVQAIIALDEKKSLAFYKRRKIAAQKLLELELFSLPAAVIYRDPANWSATLWINVGEVDNSTLQQNIVSVGKILLSD